MDTALLFSSFLLLISLVRGQLAPDAQQPDYEYQNGQFLEDDDDILPKDYISVKSPQEQSFMKGLIIEAGRKVLFPELYEEGKDDDEGKFKVFEMKGQPEMEESYMNEKVRRSKQGCPEHCPLYKPVCGSDGKVYRSECQLRKENCGIPSVTSGPWQKCRGKHYLCPSRCLDIIDPVCGSDGRIYHNVCILRKMNCGKLIEVLPARKCYDNVRQSKDMSECPESCQEVYKPACGSDGVIYYNECFLKRKTCKLGIVEVDMEDCANVPRCPGVCLPIKDPVCGSDGRLYINQCTLLLHNCGKEIKVVPRRLCGYPAEETAPAARQMK